jgi:hypothetical protein
VRPAAYGDTPARERSGIPPTMRRRLAPAALAAAAAAALLAPAPATAGDNELSVTAGPVFANRPNLRGAAPAPGLAASVAWGLAPAWSVVAGAVVAAPAHGQVWWGASAGGMWAFDVVRVVPFLSAEAAAASVGGDVRPALRAALGADYRPRRRWSVGGELAWWALAGGPAPFPGIAELRLRVTLHHEPRGL